MIFGYYKAATEINEEKIKQYESNLKFYGAEKIYIDINKNGRITNRPELTKLLKEVQKGDTIIIPTINKLAERLLTLLPLLKKFEKEGIHLYFPEERYLKDEMTLKAYLMVLPKAEEKVQKLHKKIRKNFNKKLKKGESEK